jgi:hypothetical protein
MIDIITAIQTIFRPLFKDLKTWKAWITFLKALFALSMNEGELALYRQCTGRQNPPDKPFREAWVPAGVRSGKSFIAALIAVFLAAFFNYRPYLAPGERAHILILAADRVQARIIFRYIKGFLTFIPVLNQLVKAERAEGIDLEVPFEEGGEIQISPVSIMVATCSYRTIRGFTAAAVICDEIAFWRDELAANPATEVLRAARPRLATIPISLLFCISSTHSRSGPLYQVVKDHWGVEDSDVLCWKADTRTMNPTISQKLIDRDIAADPEAARSEWFAEFRSDLDAFLPPEAIEAVTVNGRFELPPMGGTY